MPVYVIDSSRPVPPTYGYMENAFDLLEGDTLVLSKGAELAAYGSAAFGISGSLNNTLLIDGRVHSEKAYGIVTHGTVSIGATGSVYGAGDGLWLGWDSSFNRSNVVINAGLIAGDVYGIEIDDGHAIINNSGKIIGSSGIVFYGGYNAPNAGLVVNNSGLIKGIDFEAIVGSQHRTNLITNKGRIEGQVLLGDGNDIYDGRGGTITGDVFLGRGDDVAYGGDEGEAFFAWTGDDFVDGGAGADTLLLSWNGALSAGTSYTVDLRKTEKQQIGTNCSIVLRDVENLVGGNVKDVFIGNDAGNVFSGNGGNDTLDGYDGNDLLSGGTGNDLLVGGSGSDIAVFTGKFSDYVITVVAGVGITISDKRASGDGTDYLGGVEFALFSDRIYTLPPVPPIGAVTPSTPIETPATPTITNTPPETPAVKNFTFKGGKKSDTFVGGKGHDLLNGGLGNDKLTGDEGQDTFVFSTKLGKNIDRILDFQHADDTIKLSKTIFSKFEKGMLSKGAFWVGAKAHDKSDRIIYNDKTGALFYDADGTGKKYGAIKFAQLTPQTLLKHDDFFIA